MLVTGEWGIGKSHYLANLLQRRVDAKLPTLLLHGDQFQPRRLAPQILERVDFDGTSDEFFGAFAAVARSRHCRGLFVIDALNESDDKKLWQRELPGFLTAVSNYPEIGVLLSIRTTYKTSCLPENFGLWEPLEIKHPGFAGCQEDAIDRYFSHFGITPTFPVLQPEFLNPLLLRLCCESLTASTGAPSEDQFTFSSMLNRYVSVVNQRLSEKLLTCDPRNRVVQQAVRNLATAMVRTRRKWIPRNEAKGIVDNIHSSHDFENSLYRQLLHEGVIAETVRRDELQGPIDCVRFSYERFGDFWLIEVLLEQASLSGESVQPKKNYSAPRITTSSRPPDSKQIADRLISSRDFHGMIRDDIAPFRNVALLESLFVQFAERYQIELVGLIERTGDSDAHAVAFLGSVEWRSANSVTEKTEMLVFKCLSDWRLRSRVLDCLLVTGPRPDHLLNADWLHRWLLAQPMAERDAMWSIYLHEQWGDGTRLRRTVDWAWAQDRTVEIDPETRRLCGILLAWFLTSSNRFLRDRSTKALVALYDSCPANFTELLHEFRTVNDPYVSERLYAVACGLALRSHDPQAVESLAETVFEQVFSDGKPPPHILLREYAGLVVERAAHLGCRVVDDMERVAPPYESKVVLAARDMDELIATYGEQCSHLRFSLLSSMGDFACYIFGCDSNRGAHAWASDRAALEAAISYEDPRPALDHELETMSDEEILSRVEELKSSIPDFDRVRAEAEAEAEAERVTRVDLERACYLDEDLPRRWIFERVIQLGWTPERFGDFDAAIDSRGRDAHKAERIGKKYQWIAYHEFLAHITDQRPFRADWKDVFAYDGTWQLLHARDIDPTCLLTGAAPQPRVPSADSRPWWAGVEYANWQPGMSDGQWMRLADDMPRIAPLLTVRDPNTELEYVTLETFVDWESPLEPGHKRYDVPFRRIWYITRSYLLRRRDRDAFVHWAAEQEFWNRWMPESHEIWGLMSGEFFWSPAYRALDREDRNDAEWNRDVSGHHELPCDVVVPTSGYTWGGSDFDCSVDDSVAFHVPGMKLAEELGLRCGRESGTFVDAADTIVALDPSVRSPGPSALLIRRDRFESFLDENEYAFAWRILGAKETRVGGMAKGEDPTGELRVNGVFYMDGNEVRGQARADFQQFPVGMSSRKTDFVREWSE